MVKLSLNVPKEFYEEEERCGFVVSTKMKEIWAVELDLLNKLLKVCKKHNIEIYASGGTTLGAIRHKGFIPWDDDIDMAMTRENYDKLCKVAEKEFEFPYFFQTEYTDPGTLRGHAQLRNSETTAILLDEGRNFKFNQGIFIDIFPFDNVPDDDKLIEEQRTLANRYSHKAFQMARLTTRYRAFNTKGIIGTIKKILHPIIFLLDKLIHFEQIYYRKFEEECAKYNVTETKMRGLLSFQIENKKHWMYNEDYKEYIEVPFEFITIPVCKGYDRCLRNQYGDYMEFVKGGTLHGGIEFDTDKSYVEYLKN